ncbi:argininosuccinate lyase [Acidianus sulfidivorans JP7]|uniref:Argininosuccinate lyase n=1 Tax=Acidianus sulfidivorans JP7 TaxID=619593 RepID=A0A2U9INF7_9CREN|nr:argininosuccinate lyase [Acidianus sulfidivorans]AWR97551.1 argininosuccinate lyase [Acidianus sulfidivorans JP7]
MLYRKWGNKEDEVITYTSSIDSDNAILKEVKLTMKAHVIELYLQKIISKEDCSKILNAINSFNSIPEGYEDVHEALEDHIIKMAGEAGEWIGLGRSRNDHVATALRLKMREELITILKNINKLRQLLLDRSEKYVDVIFPTFTHLQFAQPSTFAHYLLYLEEELSSRWETIFDTLTLVNRSPLGSGAIVGSSIELNRSRESELLGFDSLIVNTISATSSRSDLISSVMELTNLMLSLSRIAEDMVIYSTLGIVKLPDNHVSTSSLMPQKRNPVTMEILRAKTGECIGYLNSVISIYKGLPSGYDLDLQEINKYFWLCTNTVNNSILVLNSLFDGIIVNMKDLDPAMLATDEAEKLTQNGITYRKAYFSVADKVRAGTFIPSISFKESINLKKTEGSPNPQIVLNDIKYAKDRLNRDILKLDNYIQNITQKLSQLGAIENDLQEE